MSFAAVVIGAFRVKKSNSIKRQWSKTVTLKFLNPPIIKITTKQHIKHRKHKLLILYFYKVRKA